MPQTKSDQKDITRSFINGTKWLFFTVLLSQIIEHGFEKAGSFGKPIQNTRGQVFTKIKVNTGLEFGLL